MHTSALFRKALWISYNLTEKKLVSCAFCCRETLACVVKIWNSRLFLTESTIFRDRKLRIEPIESASNSASNELLRNVLAKTLTIWHAKSPKPLFAKFCKSKFKISLERKRFRKFHAPWEHPLMGYYHKNMLNQGVENFTCPLFFEMGRFSQKTCLKGNVASGKTPQREWITQFCRSTTRMQFDMDITTFVH